MNICLNGLILWNKIRLLGTNIGDEGWGNPVCEAKKAVYETQTAAGNSHLWGHKGRRQAV